MPTRHRHACIRGRACAATTSEKGRDAAVARLPNSQALQVGARKTSKGWKIPVIVFQGQLVSRQAV
jgi:hypothetical protein